MYILKNAITSITRNKSRNLLIGIIILVISCATTVTLAINNSSNNLIESYSSKYDTEATLSINRENMMGNFDPSNKDESKEEMQNSFAAASNVSISDIENFADSEYVKDYYYTLSVGVNSSDIEQVSMSSGENEANDGRGGRPGEGFNMDNATSGDFSLKGYSSLESMNEFIEGTYTITEGSVSENFDSYDCIINSELATMNDISIGDTITVVDSQNESYSYTLTVTGIYEDNEDNTDNRMSMFSNSANTIITNANVIIEMMENNSELSVTTTPTFILTSSDVVDAFEEELREKGLDDNLTVQTNLEQIESAVNTITNVKTFAVTFLVITLIIGTIILFIINAVNIRERKYEIGVLRTIGMKKSKVSLQFISELAIVSVVFLLLGAGIGALISVPVSNSLLENEIIASQTQTNKIEGNFGFENSDKPNNIKNDNSFKGVPVVQAYDSINAVVDIKVLLELLGIGLLITLISSLSAMISIQKFSPLTILKERT